MVADSAVATAVIEGKLWEPPALPVPAVVVVEDIETSLPGLAVRPCIS